MLTEADLTAGDFVRSMKQLMDLLGQVADVAAPDSPVRGTARQAVCSADARLQSARL